MNIYADTSNKLWIGSQHIDFSSLLVLQYLVSLPKVTLEALS